MNFPPFTPARPRRHHKRRTVASAPAALGLLSATVVDFLGSDATVKLVFDCGEDDPIVNLDAAVGEKWTATIEGYAFAGTTPLELSAFNIVLVYMVNAGEALGPNVISYAGPSDIVDASGRTLAPFVDRDLE